MKKNSKTTRNYEKNHPEENAADKARQKIYIKVRNGTLKVPTVCPNCGRRGGRMEWDHDSKPQGWKCSKCHKRGRGA